MPRPQEPGQPARFNHAGVVYSPFCTEPGAPNVLTADPWSFLSAWLNQHLKSTRGANRKRLERAIYFTDLAESFYTAANATPLPAKGTLAYYGILNLVKSFLSVRGVDLETTYEHHGLSLPINTRHTVQIAGPSANSLNIFEAFAEELATPISGTAPHQLTDICSHIPEIHEIAFTLKHLPGNRRLLLPIEIDFLTNEAETMLFTETKYGMKHRSRVPVNRFHGGPRRNYFRDGEERDGHIVHRSSRRKRFTWDNFQRIYQNICSEYHTFDICSLLTSNGYRFYCDLSNPKYHHLCYSMMLMFYVGTAARYRPSEMNDLLHSDLRPLVSEAITLTPPQFLYHLVGLTTNNICCVPHAAIAR